ncbi:RNA polymerase sigma-70 factor [Pedobacter sp. MC2016-14]|uniref:RNA polymerase sigma factor n=1 Tax=Pedobacter sp. MC2016-14 TaxID=2897327 RepID=UPI001E3629E2|nr:RNA polymerase sigma-70 factor [Pedobacter sp. MC2016-14]MCD0488585.1 RNA polymerase sigma-70 factor [Pedobacter sp. MC2016-14]
MAIYNLFADKELLLKVAEGDQIAFRQVFDLYKKTIFTFVENFIHSTADAEEIVQETFVILWNNRSSLSGVDHPRNYIYTIARNKCYDYLTKVARNEKMMKHAWENTQTCSNDTESLMQVKESMLVIDKALLKLSTQKQAVFRMSRFEDMSHEEIADATGLSKSRVKNIIVEVLKHLKSRLQQASIFMFLLVSYIN